MKWIGDQSVNVVVDGLEVSHGGAGGSEKKGNAILECGSVEGVCCWEFEVTGGEGLWVGVGTQENFGPGYKMKGLLFGGPGNLSDGGSLVKGQWGPKLNQGDKICLRQEVNTDSVSVAFSKNGNGLGVAFDIKGWSDGVNLKPIVSLDTPGQTVKIRQVSPSLPMESFMPSFNTTEGILGTWTGPDTKLTITSESGTGQWRLGAKVANSLSCTVTEQPSGGFSASQVVSTKMMPPPNLIEREKCMKEMLDGLTNITRENNELRLTAGSKSEIFTQSSGSSAATKEMIRWMK